MQNTEIKYFIPSQLGILLDPMSFKVLFIIVNFKDKGAIISSNVIEKLFKIRPELFDISVQTLFDNNLVYFSNERIHPNMDKIMEYTHLKFQEVNEMDLIKFKGSEITWKQKMKESNEISKLSMEELKRKIEYLTQIYKMKNEEENNSIDGLPF